MIRDKPKVSVNLNITSCYAHHIVESFTIVIAGTLWFFMLGSVSFIINEAFPPYKDTESLGKTWCLLLLELALTLFMFHHVSRLITFTMESLFRDYPQVKTIPEFHSSVIAAFSLLLFQTTLKSRATKIFYDFYGQPRSD